MEDDSLLLMRYSDPDIGDIWQYPGGGLEPGETSILATLRNYSSHGFCVSSERAEDVAHHLVLQVGMHGDRLSIPATTRWCLKSQQSYLIGCALVNHEDSQVLRNCVANSPSSK